MLLPLVTNKNSGTSFSPKRVIWRLTNALLLFGFCIELTSADSIRTLKLIHEAPIRTLLEGYIPEKKLEASGIDSLDGTHYVVFDNLKLIAVINNNSWSKWGKTNPASNRLIDKSNKAEGIDLSGNNRAFLLIQENRKQKRQHLPGLRRGRIVEFNPEIGKSKSWIPHRFKSKKHGYEGIASVKHNGRNYILALCELSDCRSSKGEPTARYGVVHVLLQAPYQLQLISTIKLDLPEFADFSGIDMEGNRIAVVSQESSALWIGELDPDNWEITNAGNIFRFPTEDDGKIVYCNIEGVSILPNNRIAVVSDAKKKKQHERCAEKDQSIHLFSVP